MRADVWYHLHRVLCHGRLAIHLRDAVDSLAIHLRDAVDLLAIHLRFTCDSLAIHLRLSVDKHSRNTRETSRDTK